MSAGDASEAQTSAGRAIQPIGFLVALTGDWRVAAASANAAKFFDFDPSAIIGRTITDLFPGDSVHALRNRLSLLRGDDQRERLFRLPLIAGQPPFDIAIHRTGGLVVIEAQPSSERAYGDVAGTVRGMVHRLSEPTEFNDFLAESARQIRSLIGFSRVAIHRFDEDGSGEIVADHARHGLDSLTGQRVALDAGSRAQSLVRIIADVDAPAVELMHGGKPIDLSLSVLRAPTPIEIEQLAALGMRAAMYIPIRVDDHPWGQVACHHQSPRSAGFERRSIVELFVQMLGMRIESRLLRQALDNRG